MTNCYKNLVCLMLVMLASEVAAQVPADATVTVLDIAEAMAADRGAVVKSADGTTLWLDIDRYRITISQYERNGKLSPAPYVEDDKDYLIVREGQVFSVSSLDSCRIYKMQFTADFVPSSNFGNPSFFKKTNVPQEVWDTQRGEFDDEGGLTWITDDDCDITSVMGFCNQNTPNLTYEIRLREVTVWHGEPRVVAPAPAVEFDVEIIPITGTQAKINFTVDVPGDIDADRFRISVVGTDTPATVYLQKYFDRSTYAQASSSPRRSTDKADGYRICGTEKIKGLNVQSTTKLNPTLDTYHSDGTLLSTVYASDKPMEISTEGLTTGVEDVAADWTQTPDAPQYFDLMGHPVAEPAQGIYLMRTAGRTSKVLLK